MTFIVGNVIDDQIEETAKVMNFAAGNVKRLTNPILNNGLEKLGNSAGENQSSDTVFSMSSNLADDYSMGVYMSIDTPQYAASIDAAVQSIDEISDGIIGEYKKRFGETPEAAFSEITAAHQSAEDKIRENLDTQNIIDSIDATFTQNGGLTDTLYRLVSEQRFTASTIRQVLGDMIVESFQKYGQNKVSTPLEVFSREVSEILNKHYEDIGDWFFYDGPDDNKNRDFCEQNVRGYYHRAEIEQWPNDWGYSWSGMIEGTDSSSIFVLLGGYNCRHHLEAKKVSEVPQADINRVFNAGIG